MADHLNREQIKARLLNVYTSYYNIEQQDEQRSPLVAVCEFFEHSEKYVLSKKANLWSADGEEFLYLFEVPHLTKEIYQKCMDQALEEGMPKMHIGPGHMYSYITAQFICDTADADALTALKKSRKYKSFHFSLHGWMDYHAVAVTASDEKIISNGPGKNAAKFMKKVLYSTKRRERTK